MIYFIELLRADHKLEDFDCGDLAKNNYLKKFALQNTKGGLGRTYVATGEGDPLRVRGYYTVSSSSVTFDPPPKHLPRYPLPTVLIGKLATDKETQNKGLGSMLLFDALERSARVAEEIGIFLVEIQAINQRAREIYEKRGFTPMVDDPLKMYMNLKTVRKLLAS
ncbi:MAG: GNAT family N-acetyltransferase [Pyrinomonadaceae bacterium]